MTSAVKHGCDHVFFVGFLGAGKSTLARNLGRMFRRPFVDTDRLVERRCGSTVTKLFEEFGEERFRELETAALEGLRGERSLLVSCGGGIVETPRNIELMHDMGFACISMATWTTRCARFAGATRAPISAAPSTPRACSSIVDRCTSRPPTSPLIFAARRSPMCPTPLPNCSWSVVSYDDSSQASQLWYPQHRFALWMRCVFRALKMLAGAVGRPCRAFMVADADLPEDLVLNVRRSLIDAGYRVDEVALDGESASSFATVGGLFAHLASFGLTAEDLVVGVGSAPVCSISAYIARSWCGGSACALVPTTLDAMIMAPTQMVPLSVGVHDAVVSLAPEVGLVICDLDLVRAFDSKRNGLGYALTCAASLAESRKCWESFESTVEGMVAGSEVSLMEAFTSAHTSRMNTAKSASPSARRAFMYGDTTARALAACLKDPSIPGYRLYAEGMRFEARLAVDVCEFPVDEMFALDDRLEDLGIEELPVLD